jgi:hypothetical protein
LVNTGPNEVGGHEVGRELDALERAADRARERLDGQRLREARDAFDEQVPLREDRDEHALEERVLADDDLLDLVENALRQRRVVGRDEGMGVHAFLE